VSRDERGYASILMVGFTLIALGVAGLAVDGTRAFLFRRSLQNAADAAALAGASEIDRQSYYVSSGRDIALDPEEARGQAGDWLGMRSLDARAAIDADDEALRVVLRGEVETTFLRVIGVTEVPVAVESVARPVAGAP
jgi:hypothetical protein